MTGNTNPCQEFFERHAHETNKAELLQRAGHAIAWETLTASRFSPGPVSKEESVLRLVISPVHVDAEDGSIKPTIMSDVKDKGGSVQRLAHTSREEIIAFGRALADAKNVATPGGAIRSICGTVKLSVHEVRGLVVAEETRAFGVFDTAKEGDSSHADIFQIAGTPQAARSARLQLWELANKGFQST